MNHYSSRFGFHSVPFSREFNIDKRFSSQFFEEALTALERTTEGRASAALIAPAGSGKTALLRTLAHRLPEVRFRVHYVKVTGLSKRDMCREIAFACGAKTAGTYPLLVRHLQEKFLSLMVIDGVRPVLILDEAHDLRPEVLDILRILTNFEMDSKLVVSIILAGQPHLRDLLRRDAHEAVARRLAHVATLRLLTREESNSYVTHRCNIAGANVVVFHQSSLEALYEITCGNLRAIDQLAAKSLEVAHDSNTNVVDSNHVIQARKLLWP
jgi:type II secretory pathway predicted ATPase ExeA